MKTLILCLTTTILFTACASKNTNTFDLNKLELIKKEEKDKLTDKELMNNANYYTFSNLTCSKIDLNILKKSYSKKIADLKEIDEEDVNETDLKKFFVNGIIENGLFGDKNYQNKILTNSEFKANLLIGTYNNKLAFRLGNYNNLFFFENEKDCLDFIN